MGSSRGNKFPASKWQSCLVWGLAWLALGGVITAGVAVGRAWSDPEFGYWTHSGCIPDPRPPAGGFWGVGRIDTFGASLIWARPGVPRGDFSVRPVDRFIPGWSSLLGMLALRADGTAIPQSEAEGQFCKQAGFGWPVIAMRATWVDEQLIHGIPIASSSGRLRALPTEVLPVRFAINSVFYAVCGWLALRALQHVRVWAWRSLQNRRAGRCVKCGYLLAGITSQQCPECGAETTCIRAER